MAETGNINMAAGDSARTRAMPEYLQEDGIAHESGDIRSIPENSHRLNPLLQSSMSLNDQLTVDRKWKVEEELAEKLNQENRPSRIIPVFKWLITVLLGLAITCLLVSTRLSFISLSLALNMTAPSAPPNDKNLEDWTKYTGQFLVIYMVITVPYLLMFLRATWVGLLSTLHPWPRRSSILLCIVTGVLEPLGVIVMALKVLPNFSLPLGVLISSLVILLPIVVEALKHCRSNSWLTNIAKVVSAVLAVAALCITAFMVNGQLKHATYIVWDSIHIFVGVVSLNIAWLPRLLKFMSRQSTNERESAAGRSEHGDDNSDSYSVIETEEASSSLLIPNTQQNSTPMHRFPRNREPRKNTNNNAAWKAAFITYGVKTVSTFLLSFIFFYIDTNSPSDSFSQSSHTVFLLAWKFSTKYILGYTWVAFGVNLIGSLLCYGMVFIASHTNMQRGCLTIPFILSIPLTVGISYIKELCDVFDDVNRICNSSSPEWYFVFMATAAITIAQTLSFGRYFFRKEKLCLQKEDKVFWIPGYNGAIMDVWLLLDCQKTIKEGRVSRRSKSKSWRTRVYICTTMYREDESEMQQLLESLAKINAAQDQGETFFESHIIFDGGVNQMKLSEFSLILISLLEDTLRVSPTMCTKIITPYGMKLSWGLPSAMGKKQMTFNIHLKDNTLVKNKKRWSQVMYMSYVLDFLADTAGPDEEVYILTTDADVMFTPDSVEALLDLMSRDPTIGAVCARTHPMGSGPLVWYQIFEYAVGHWFQKAAEHVLGSVLCAPGCFSVYRCRALQDVLPKYCRKVESSFDFLTKDMGEDRWLCTLMVQSGWRIEYCAASENSTNCPSEFEEFYKQRRRWIASTLANLMLIIEEWKYIKLFNHRVSVMFLLYQVLLLFSTLISPSTVVLVVAGGLFYAWNIDALATVVIQIILCVLFALACILAAPKTHIILAKVYTFVYAVVMCAVVVGTAEQIVTDLSSHSQSMPNSTHASITTQRPANQHISIDIPVSITTIYLAFLVLIFTLAGFLHPKEITCLFHGICFLLCIPSAYLILMIYSICNLTDSSWGTREGTSVSTTVKKSSWISIYKKALYSIFFCFAPKPKTNKGIDVETQTVESYLSRSVSLMGATDGPQNSDEDATTGEAEDTDNLSHYRKVESSELTLSVDDWLPPDFQSKYSEIFKKYGFDSTLFIKGLTETDLNRMGIKKRGHVQFLMAEIARLPAFEIEYKVPTNSSEWLEEIGLSRYSENFRRNHIRTPKEMEILKRFDKNEIAKELGITKEGHVKRLLEAIRMLRDPSEAQTKAIRMRQVLDETPVHYLQDFNVDEYEFWKRLRAKCLEPDLKAFGIDAEVKAKLVELRNNWLLVMAVANTLWLILITTLASNGDLTLLGANPLGLVFLFIFGLIFIIQFISMLAHRLSTLCHYIARAPYTFGKPFLTSWSFKDKADNNFADSEDVSAIRQVQHAADRARKKVAVTTKQRKSGKIHRGQHLDDETAPLLMGGNSQVV